ncbi:hypothetical protein MMC22_011083, partial [Lobaria immixta]|nr:hypothetical protein [Lobaria immixta]
KSRAQGVAPANLELPTKLPELRDATPLWVTNAVEYLNTPILADDKIKSVGSCAWKNCRARQWDLSYKRIASAVALAEWFKMPVDFRAKIEGSQPLPTGISSSTKIEEDVLKDIEGKDGVDVPLSLSSAQVLSGESARDLKGETGFFSTALRLSDCGWWSGV